MEREFPDAEYADLTKVVEGGICPCCGKRSLTISRGIEVGNIFQLGTKYTKTMNMTYVDKDGSIKNPIMGCYGIGVGRMAASICEAHHEYRSMAGPHLRNELRQRRRPRSGRQSV